MNSNMFNGDTRMYLGGAEGEAVRKWGGVGWGGHNQKTVVRKHCTLIRANPSLNIKVAEKR